MSWLKIRYMITTPAFVGGAGTRADTRGIRVSEIRGALRYWYRAFSASAVGNDLSQLRKRESAVFGSTDAQSAVRLRALSPTPRPLSPGPASWLHPGILYLLGPGLCSPASRGNPATLNRGYLSPGAEGTIEIDPGPHRTAVAACLWALSTLGGIGARTRRGFGGIAFARADLQQLWSDIPPLFPTEEAIRCVRSQIAESTAKSNPKARYPHTADPCVVHVARGGWNCWPDALSAAGKALRKNRGSAPGGRFGHTPEYNSIVEPWVNGGREFDPAPEFPLGAFGLPIVFKGGAVAQPRLKSKPKAPLRRSSPMYIRGLEEEPQSWALITFAMAGEFLPAESEVMLTKSGRTQQLTITPGTVDKRLQEWFVAFAALDRSASP